MKVDYSSDRTVFVDFETTSLCDLRVEGGRAYAMHPSTRVLCCAVNGGSWGKYMWVPGWVPLQLPQKVEGFMVVREMPLLEFDVVLCGHNALEFDRLVWERFVGTQRLWRDTMPLCRAAGLPGGLDAACGRLFGLHKDPRGRILEVLCRAQLKSGGVFYPIGTSAAWHDLLAYCANDCLLLEKLHEAVIGYAEPDVLWADACINERGFPIDRALAARLAVLQDELATKARDDISSLTEDSLKACDVGSVAKVKKWLEEQGVTLPMRNGRPSMIKADLVRLLEDPEEFCGGTEESAELVAKVLKLRQEVARNTVAKSLRMLRVTVVDGRARGQFAYHSAHTGRWGGRAIQPHNFPVGFDGVSSSLARDDLTLAEVEAEAARLSATPAEVLSSLLRPCVSSGKPLAVADYGQVEARGICWVFGEERALDFFRDTSKDYYRDFIGPLIYGPGVRIGDKERWFAKQTGLGAGYGMSGRKMRAMMVAKGIDFEAAGVSPEGIIKAYRQGHPKVVAGWREMDDALFAAMRGESRVTGRTLFEFVDGSLVLTLPSGRRLTYREAAVEMHVPVWAVMYGMSMEPRPTVCYTHTRGWRATLYGGRVVENVVQALCRDMLADGLVKTERLGYEPVLHVHDEEVGQNCTADQLAEALSVGPAWANGFPVLVEAFSAPRYLKKAVHKFDYVRYLDGRKV